MKHLTRPVLSLLLTRLLLPGFIIYAIFVTPSLANALSWEQFVEDNHERYVQQYTTAKFKALDTDGSNSLSKDELQAAPGWVSLEGTFGDARAQRADANNDGELSLKEARTYRRWEAENWKKLSWEHRRKLVNWYDDADFLKHHPKVAKQLSKQEGYLKDHPQLAKALFADSKFLVNHPDKTKQAYAKRKDIAKHPNAARKAYRKAKKRNEG